MLSVYTYLWAPLYMPYMYESRKEETSFKIIKNSDLASLQWCAGNNLFTVANKTVGKSLLTNATYGYSDCHQYAYTGLWIMCEAYQNNIRAYFWVRILMYCALKYRLTK
jgi:hypothetical protein